MMRTARKYIYKRIFQAVLFITAGFLALFMFFDALNDLSFSSRTSLTYGIANSLAYIALLLPGHIYELLPIALLIGCIFVMSTLAQTSEFTILRTSGLTPWHALRSLLWVGALFTVLTFLVGDYVSPQTEKLAQFYKARFEGNVTAGRTGAWIKENIGGLDRIVNVQELTPDGEMRNLRIFDFDKAGFLSQMRKVESASFAPGTWHMRKVQVSALQTEGQQHRVNRSTAEEAMLETTIQQSMVAAALLKPDRMSTLELYRYISHLKANGQSAQNYEIQFWRKFFYPLSCLVMVMLALPFAYLHFRSGNIATMVFIGVIAGISFFLMNNVAGYIGNLRAWTPWLAAAVPSLVYMGISLFAFRWLVRNR